MSDWNATLYRRFERERTRPAADLLAQVAHPAARIVVDLGCGPGNSTALLAVAFPEAKVTGIDTSPTMLANARERCPTCLFDQADIASWDPDAPPDVIFANASLQWVPDHASLLPRLLACLAPGGVLAVQMPDNRQEPSHRAMREVAAEPPFAALVDGTAAGRVGLLSLEAYYDLLASQAGSVEVWRTTYNHPMASPGAIVDWVRSTGLRPFIDPLSAEHRAVFLARYETAIDAAYPPRADGQRLLAFPRLFIVARARSAMMVFSNQDS